MKQVSRREFISKSAFGLGSVMILPSNLVLGKNGRTMPGNKVNVAFCGIGNRGKQVFMTFMDTGMINNVAMCDTDMGAPHTLEVLQAYPNVPRYNDFRVMFDKMHRSIDAVVVCTPDFSHFPITILAMSLGKHVFVEKPPAAHLP